MSALRGRVYKRDYILPGGDRYVAWVAEVYPTRPDPRLKVDAAVYRQFWDNHAEALADVNSYLQVAA